MPSRLQHMEHKLDHTQHSIHHLRHEHALQHSQHKLATCSIQSVGSRMSTNSITRSMACIDSSIQSITSISLRTSTSSIAQSLALHPPLAARAHASHVAFPPGGRIQS